MLFLNVRTENNNNKEVEVYNRWDIGPGETILTSWKNLSKDDIGKFLKFDDGSDFYTKIKFVARTIVGTNTGIYKKSDAIHCAIIKSPQGSYTGVSYRERSLTTQPLTEPEKEDVKLFFQNKLEHIRGPRVSKAILDIYASELAELKYSVKESVQSIVAEARKEKHGQHWFKCVKALNIMMGCDIERLPEKEKDEGEEQDLLQGGDVLSFLDTVEDAEIILEQQLSKKKTIPDGNKIRAIQKLQIDVSESNILEEF